MKHKKLTDGFSLVEVIVALVIISVGLSFLSLLFTQQRLNTVNSEIKTSAVVFSQRILDRLRQKDPSILPKSDTKQCPPPSSATAADIDLCPPNLSNQNPYSFIALIKFSPAVDSNGIAICQDTCRQIKLEVRRDEASSQNTLPIYSTETVYTKFE